MTKPLSSFPLEERSTVASRRIRGETKGLGYWAAKDYEYRRKVGVISKKKEKQES